MKTKLLLLLSILIFGCKSVSKTILKNEPINEKTIREKSRDCTIEIPKTWYAFIDKSHNLVTYAPVGVELKENGFPSTTFSAWKTKRYNCKYKDLKKMTDCYVKNVSRSFKDYKYEIIKVKHKIYGNYFFIKSSFKKEDVISISIKGFIKKNKTVFELYYSSREKEFDTYLSDVQEMINSLVIK